MNALQHIMLQRCSTSAKTKTSFATITFRSLSELARHHAWKALKEIRADIRGASAVEFAIVAPIFLLIVLGGMVWGIYLGTSHSVAQLTADAARASVAGLSDAERSKIARDHIAATAADYPLIDPAKLTVVAQATGSDNRLFRVSVSYDAGGLPIWFLDGLVPLPSKTMVRAAVVERGGY